MCLGPGHLALEFNFCCLSQSLNLTYYNITLSHMKIHIIDSSDRRKFLSHNVKKNCVHFGDTLPKGKGSEI